MGDPIKNPKGINFKEHPTTGTIDMGINIDQFIDTLLSYKPYASEAGWINLNLFRNRITFDKKDYSHTPKLKHPDLPVEKANPKRVEDFHAKKSQFVVGGCETTTWDEGKRGLKID
jgi:hypothetical protein